MRSSSRAPPSCCARAPRRRRIRRSPRCPETTVRTAALIERYPDRFLFGTDDVAPKTQEAYLKVFHQYEPLWKVLKPDTSEKVRKGNYARLFDAARVRVRAWEKANPPVARGGDGTPVSGIPANNGAGSRWATAR